VAITMSLGSVGLIATDGSLKSRLDHPFAKRARLSLRELAREPLLLLAQDITPGLMDLQMTALHERGLTPPRVRDVGDPQTLLSLVASGEGVSPTATCVEMWRSFPSRKATRPQRSCSWCGGARTIARS
jgi:DNA-binding transcriptional LysR family regulator